VIITRRKFCRISSSVAAVNSIWEHRPCDFVGDRILIKGFVTDRYFNSLDYGY
jgi:hypothetical protein